MSAGSSSSSISSISISSSGSTSSKDGGTGAAPEDFSRVASIASGWMLDFCFTAVCRRFLEGGGGLEEFNQALHTLQAVSQGGSTLRRKENQKNQLAGFLGRIMHGQQLDVVYEDTGLMPLMSAVNLWRSLGDVLPSEQELHRSITTHLYIQSVAVCLEKGQKFMAFTALKWLEEEHDIPQNLAMKLSTIVTKGDIYHPFVLSFPYEHLLEKARTYVEAFLAQNPPGFLLQAAAKLAQSCPSRDSSDEQEESSSESPPLVSTSKLNLTSLNLKANNKTIATTLRPKRRLLATKQTELWKPDSAKKPRKTDADNQQMYRRQLAETTLNTGRSKKKWTYEMDECLKKGVRKRGVGKWALMLLDHDFKGRTGTMLKDRWRILKKSHTVT